MQNGASVIIIQYPQNLLKTVYTACRTCYSEKDADGIWQDDISEEKMLALVTTILDSGHMSVIEHCHVVFAISGLTRACTHQLVRHRHVSFSQKSQRYVREKGEFEYMIPRAIEASAHAQDFKEMMSRIAELYAAMIGSGIAPEDARSILPNAATSSMVMSTNLRELIHIANLRLCTRAQYEIRMLIGKICDLVIERDPWLGKWLVPKCVKLGYCDERVSCGRYPTRDKK